MATCYSEESHFFFTGCPWIVLFGGLGFGCPADESASLVCSGDPFLARSKSIGLQQPPTLQSVARNGAWLPCKAKRKNISDNDFLPCFGGDRSYLSAKETAGAQLSIILPGARAYMPAALTP